MVFRIESRLYLPADPASASRARTFVREALAAWGAEEFEEPATLLTSELVTNAVLHARSATEVIVRLADGQLWVGVSDGNAGPPVRKRYGPEAATGRGLLLIERIASAWGSESSGSGKVVWFQLRAGTAGTAMDAMAADLEADLAELAELGGGPAAGASGGPGRDSSGPRPSARRHHSLPRERAPGRVATGARS